MVMRPPRRHISAKTFVELTDEEFLSLVAMHMSAR